MGQVQVARGVLSANGGLTKHRFKPISFVIVACPHKLLNWLWWRVVTQGWVSVLCRAQGCCFCPARVHTRVVYALWLCSWLWYLCILFVLVLCRALWFWLWFQRRVVVVVVVLVGDVLPVVLMTPFTESHKSSYPPGN